MPFQIKLSLAVLLLVTLASPVPLATAEDIVVNGGYETTFGSLQLQSLLVTNNGTLENLSSGNPTDVVTLAGNAIVNGAGNWYVIGQNLNIPNSGSVYVDNGTLYYQANSSSGPTAPYRGVNIAGDVVLNGTSSSWYAATERFDVQRSGTITLTNGARLSTDMAFGGRPLSLAGNALIQGARSSWNVTIGTPNSNGVSSTGRLQITDGGSYSTEGFADIAGTVDVIGSGSRFVVQDVDNYWSYGEPPLFATVTVTGTMNVQEGGRVITKRGVVAEPWSPTGVLRLDDGGIFQVADHLTVNPFGTLQGDGGIVQGDVINHGLITPGNSTGHLTINGDLTNTGSIQLEIEDYNSFDQLTVSGELLAGGIIEVIFADSFIPTSGTTFQLLSFGQFIDNGFTLDLSSALLDDPRMSWDTSQFTTNGTLRLVPEPGSCALAAIALVGILGFWRRKKGPRA